MIFFQKLGQVVRRTWPLLLGIWLLLLLASWLTAPPWEQVAQDQEFVFLPANSPSRRAEELLARAFPTDHSASNIVLALYRAGSQGAPPTEDQEFIANVLEPDLRQIAEAEGGLAYEIKPSEEPLFAPEGPPSPPAQRSLIARILTPNTPGAGALLVSPDGQLQLVVVELTNDFLSKRSWPTIDKIQHLVQSLRQEGKIPSGVEIALTGSAVLGRDHALAELQSVQATGVLTVLLVITLLVLIYRAPLLAIIPLVTVYLAVKVALNLLALMAGHGYLAVFNSLQIFITILAYGAGVDYCLFLTGRYREEMDRGASPTHAVANAIGGVGAAVTASAATVICGIGMMSFAEFGKFHDAGLAIPLSLLLVLGATLTFTPSLLRLVGTWAFWPQRWEPAATAEVRSAERAPAAPETTPALPGGLFQAGLLGRIWDRVGQLLLRRAGTVWLITFALMAPFAVIAGLLYHHINYDVIGTLPTNALSHTGTQLLQEHFPDGIIGPVTVVVVNPQVDFQSAQGRALIEQLTNRLREQQAQLGLADIRSLTLPLGTTPAAAQPLAGYNIPEDMRREAAEQLAEQHYLTDLGEHTKIGTRLDLVLQHSPFSRQSIEDLDRLEQSVRDALPAEVRDTTQLAFAGTTASVRDLANVMQRDRTRIELLVLASVFLILILLLRGFIVPLYLLLSVLFSYYTTLGVAFVVFWLLDPSGFTGIDWKVVIFLFTILIAVGEDYNIFLMTRIREEEVRHGPLEGITVALDRTGPIISSCGIIMAGTFASLLAGSLTEMKQLGFALTFGVLLDTFIVRPILVPAFLILMESGRLPLAGAADGFLCGPRPRQVSSEKHASAR